MLFMGAIGMFVRAVGMLYTPILVDRLQLTFPSGLAVANILRALTDPVLLKKSVARLGSGIAMGLLGGVGAAKWALLGTIDLSTSTLGAGNAGRCAHRHRRADGRPDGHMADPLLHQHRLAA